MLIEPLLECHDLLYHGFQIIVPRQLNGQKFITKEDLVALHRCLSIQGYQCRLQLQALQQDNNSWILDLSTDYPYLIAIQEKVATWLQQEHFFFNARFLEQHGHKLCINFPASETMNVKICCFEKKIMLLPSPPKACMVNELK